MTPSKRLSSLLVAGGLAVCLQAERPVNILNAGNRPMPKAMFRPEAEADDPTTRRAAMREWFGEYTPEYRQFLMGSAARERDRWGSMIPGSGRFLALKAAGNHWTNLGPTTASYEWNGSSYNAIDSGRPVAIVVDPTDANVIYNATAGGGVWKTTDGGTTWNPITESLGSLSMGHLAMDPNDHNTLYLGLGDAFDGTGVGLVKSTDGGSTWSSIVYLGTSTVINWVGVSSSNSQIVLAATNAGLYRSTDGGATFGKVTISTGTGVDPYCWTLAWGGGTNWALSLEANQAATSGTGQIWYSTDDGANWTQSTGFTQSTVGLTRASIASAPTSRTTMYAYAAGYSYWGSTDAGSDTADMYRSTDGGHTWTALGVTSGYKSATKSFTTKYTNTNTDSTYPGRILGGQGWYNQMIIVDASDATTFYVGGNLNLAKVTSATTTPSYTVLSNWLAQYSQPYIHADFHAGAFGPDGSLYMGTDGGFFKRTSAASNTWSYSLNTGIISHLCYSVGSSLANTNAVITGMQDNGTRVRSGATSTFDQPLGGDGFGSNINASDATQMLGTLYYARIYKSTTSGSTGGSFSLASTGITESNNSSSAPFITRLTPWAGDSTGNTVLTFVNLKVYKTTNYAGGWSALGTSGLLVSSGGSTASGSIRNVGIAKTDANVIGVVASGGRVFTTTNGGTSWSEKAGLESGAPTMSGSGGYLSYISFSPQNSSVVYVASVNPDSTANHLWKSSNGGSNWASIDGSAGTSNGFPFGVPVNCIVEDPGDSQTLYAGTHEGVYRSTDGGSSWSRFGAGLPLVNVTDLYLAPDSSLLRISTFGRGIWEFDLKTTTVSASITTPSSNQTVSSGTNVSFTGSATDQDPASTLSYGWDFGDGSTGTGASTSHTFTNATGSDVVYTVTFTATGSTGGLGTTTRLITVSGADTVPPTGTCFETGGRAIVSFGSNVSDNVGVTKVTYFLDGKNYGSRTTAPYGMGWNSTLGADGTHSLYSIVYDAAGNSTTTATVDFSIDNTAPTGTCSETGSRGIVSFGSSVSDNVGVAKVTYFLDGKNYGSRTTAPYGMGWNSTLGADGTHSLYSIVYDAAGNSTTTATVDFTIDNTAPTGTCSETGSRGIVSFGSSVSDNVGVAKVTYFLDGKNYGTRTTAPYGMGWNSTLGADGTHSLYSVIYDAAGNSTTTATVDFSIDNTAPTGSCSENGSKGVVYFFTSASDNVGVTKVNFYLDGKAYGTKTTAPYSMGWNSTLGADGTHSLYSVIFDAAGNSTTTSTVNFSIDNTVPTGSTSVVGTSGTIQLNASATDNVGVTKVDFYIDGAFLGTTSVSPYSMGWDSTLAPNGSHTLGAKAYDAAGNVADLTPTVFNVAN